VEIHESVLLWRERVPVHGVLREVQCSMDHLGEGFYELRLRCGKEILRNEPFQETSGLLKRAEELRSEAKAGSA
jgi:hypothetical protein